MIEQITMQVLEAEVYLLSIYAKSDPIGYDRGGSDAKKQAGN